MNKEQYLTELRSKLRGMNQEDIDDVLAYCEEYFDEAGVENEQQVIEELGTPSKYAVQIRAEAIIRNNENHKGNHEKRKNPHSSVKNVVTIFLGICALPLALPLMLAVACLVFAFLVVIASFIFAAIVSAGAIFISGIPLIISGITNLSTPGNAMVAFGGGFLAIGLGLLLTLLFVSLVRVMIPAFTRAVTRIYNKAKGGYHYEKA